MKKTISILFVCLLVASSVFAKDRTKAVDLYLKDFCAFDETSHIHTAIKNVLIKMPEKEFRYVTNRHRPVIFTDTGSSRFASSQEFFIEPGSKPCCQQGFTMIKIGGSLEESKDVTAIEGVIAHELAHRVLEHIKNGHLSCKSEREANRLIKTWGFGEEFKAAAKDFAHKKEEPAACQE